MPYVRANSAYCGSSPARAEPMQTARQSISRKKRLFISATIGECQCRAGTMRIQIEQSPPGDTNIAFLTEPLKKELTSSAPPIHLPPPLPAGPHQPPFEQRPAPTRQYPLASGRYPSPPGTKKVRPCGPASLERLLHRPKGSPLKAPPVKEGFGVVVCIGWRHAADSRADPKIAAGARWPPSSLLGTKKGQTL